MIGQVDAADPRPRAGEADQVGAEPDADLEDVPPAAGREFGVVRDERLQLVPLTLDLGEELRRALGRVRVRITGNEAAARRSINVTARVNEGDVPSPADEDRIQRTEVYRVIRESAGVPPRVLRVLNGSGQDREFTIRGAATTIGRALDNDLVLESTDVSRHHARIEYRDGRYQIADLGSTNGTKVNGRPVQGSAPLSDGDEIEFGSLQLRFMPYQIGV